MLSEISQAAYLLLLCIFVPLPFATDRKIIRVPWVTYWLIAINFIVFLIFVLPTIGTSGANNVFDNWGVVPRQPNSLHLLTYLFIHVSLAHLFWNTAFLWLFGPSVEDAIGHLQYLALYLAGGVVAGMLHTAIVLLFAQNSAAAFAPMVGASGAISAIVGLYAVRFYRSKLRLVWGCAWFLELPASKFELPALAGLSLWLLQNLAGAILSLFAPDRNGIAYWAHIGGFLFGMTVADISGMLGDGIREYLFADAVNAGELGEEGARSAVANFQLLLQRRPHDNEVRDALAVLAQQAMVSDSSVVRRVVSEAYCLLLEQSLSGGDSPKTRGWLVEFDDVQAEQMIERSSLLRLAGRAAKAGQSALADRFYLTVINRFPNTIEWEYALADAAALRLETGESAEQAVELLTQSLTQRKTATGSLTVAEITSQWNQLWDRIKQRQS